MSACNICALFCFFLILSPLGKVRLGGSDAVPRYSRITWFSMIFTAGVAIGLLFYGVLEPVYYFQNPPWELILPIPRRLKPSAYPRQPSTGGSPRGHFTRPQALASLFLLQQGTASHDPLCILPPSGRTSMGLERTSYRYTRHIRHIVRSRHITRPWRETGRGRP